MIAYRCNLHSCRPTCVKYSFKKRNSSGNGGLCLFRAPWKNTTRPSSRRMACKLLLSIQELRGKGDHAVSVITGYLVDEVEHEFPIILLVSAE